MARVKDKTKRALGINTMGKGDKSRVRDFKKYCENYDEIDWGHSQEEIKKNLKDYINNKGKIHKNER